MKLNGGSRKGFYHVVFLGFLCLVLLAACNVSAAGSTSVSVASQPTSPAVDAVTPTVPDPSPTAVSTPASTAATATPAPAVTAPAVELPPLNELTINLVPVVGGLTRLTSVTPAGDDSGRLFILEQAGRILIIENGAVNPTPFLDIVSLVGSDGIEQGLLGLAFHPDYVNNGFFYVYYTDKQGDTVVARYTVSADSPALADPASAKILLAFDQPYGNHNGGQLAFGPDGYLYIGTGDGGSANDPHNNGQRLDTFLGKILRIDVDGGDPYALPAGNPFVDEANALPEIWSYGWRNPWRFSFDRQTGDLYIADVGQNQYEEVNFEPAGSPGGLNYGWRLMEGLHCFDPVDCDPAAQGLVLPIAEYDHSLGCSVTGGYVYRGSQFPALTGVYLYADYCTGFIWGLRREADGSWSQAEMLQSGFRVSSFGQDEAGELYVADHVGNLLRIVVQ